TNLAQAFPALSPAERRRIGRRSFQHFGVLFVELAATLARPLERTLATLHLEGLEHLRGVMATHGRALVLTAHLGNWELLTAARPPVRTRTPVVPTSSPRDGRRHRATIHPPLAPPAVNDVERAVVELTMRCTAAIETAIRQVPEQWLWTHDRWRTRPAAEGRP